MAKNKKMSYKKKKIICTIAMVITGLLFILLLTIAYYHDFGIYVNEPLYAGVFIAYAVFVIIMMVVGSVLEFDFTPPPNEIFKKTTKYKLNNYIDSETFLKDTDNRIKKINYNLVKNGKIEDNGFVSVYMKPKEEDILDIIILIRVKEYSKKIEKEIEKIVNEFATEFYGEKSNITDYVRALRIICVDKITSAFQEESSIGIDTKKYSESLTVGVSFGSKKLFIREFVSKWKRKNTNITEKSIWQQNSYDKQDIFKEIIFKLINATKIIEEKEE